jgi:hypothetical protein
MKNIAEEYMTRMGFDNNLYIIFRHHDSNHPHCHILAQETGSMAPLYQTAITTKEVKRSSENLKRNTISKQ